MRRLLQILTTTGIPVVLFCGFLAVALGADNKRSLAAGKLHFGGRYREEEKVFGSAIMEREPTSPLFSEVSTYAPSELPDGIVRVYRDRDHDAVRFEFEFTKRDNGGNDPRTGRPWRMPDAFVNQVLQYFNAEWRVAAQNRMTSKDGRMLALVADNLVAVTQP